MRNGPMENIMEDRRDVVILPPVTNEPCCSIEYRLESVQEARRHSGEQAVAVVNPRSDKSGDIRLRSPKRQRLDATPEKTELAKATVHTTWRLIDRSDSSRTPRSCTEVEGRIKAPQTLSSPMSRWMHRLRVAHHRKSVFSGLSLLKRIHSAIRSTSSSIRRRCCGWRAPCVKLRVIGVEVR